MAGYNLRRIRNRKNKTRKTKTHKKGRKHRRGRRNQVGGALAMPLMILASTLAPLVKDIINKA